MVTKTKSSPSDKLARLREKVKGLDLSSGSAGFWSPKQGKNQIRILPEVGEMEFFFQSVGRHTFPGDQKKSVYCPRFTSEDVLPCPVCEIVDELYSQGEKELAGQLRVRRMFWMNVIVRNSEGEDTGPFIYTPGVTVFNDVVALVGDPDYGDITDPDDGFDLVIDRNGQGIDTSYQVVPRRNPGPLSKDADLADEWLEKARNLSFVEVSEDPSEDSKLAGTHAIYVLPYNRIVSEFDLDNLDTEEATPKSSSSKSKVEEVDEDEDEDEDKDEDKAPPAKKEITHRRQVRRSNRR